MTLQPHWRFHAESISQLPLSLAQSSRVAGSKQGASALVTAHYRRQTPPKVTPARTSAILPFHLCRHPDDRLSILLACSPESAFQNVLRWSPPCRGSVAIVLLRSLAVFTGIVSVSLACQYFLSPAQRRFASRGLCPLWLKNSFQKFQVVSNSICRRSATKRKTDRDSYV